jgi:hypothetical protein
MDQTIAKGVRRMSPDFGTKKPAMTSAISIAQTLERRERLRGVSSQSARETLARKLQVGLGTVENLIRGRVKRIDDTIRGRLQALLVRELESEIARLTHELEIARQGGAHLASEQISEIETHLSRASSLLSGGGSR